MGISVNLPVESWSDVFRAVPTFFRANCWEAKRGGTLGYHLAGWHLAIHLQSLLEPAADEDRVASKLDELDELFRVAYETVEEHQAARDEVVLCWFDREFPRCMALVPRRRRSAFLKGVRMAVEDGRVFSY